MKSHQEALLDQFQTENTLLKTENLNLKNKVEELTEQLDWFNRNLFGKRSEKHVEPSAYQLTFDFYDKLEKADPEQKTRKVAAHERRTKTQDKDKVALPDDMPKERKFIDIPEEEKVCKETGVPLVKIGEEVTSKLAFKPGSYFIKEIVRPKYAVPKNPDIGIITAELPESLLDRCMADESFLADILVKKYADHLPLNRQVEMLSRVGIHISRQLLSQWAIRASIALKPLYEIMREKILGSGNVFIDETPVKLLQPKKSKEAYVWVLVGGEERDPSYRVYKFFENRKHCNAQSLLGDYNGFLHSDKYGAYERMANSKKFIWCPCWSHIRRKFFEVEAGDLKFRDWVLMKIKHLFMLERVAWSRSAEERLKIRTEKEIPIIDELIDAIKEKLINGKLLPKSKMKTALGYFLGLVPYLKNYTLAPFARLDNNPAERAVRPLAIGRKNWLFFGSENGGEAAGIIYSLIQTCRAFKLNPRDYLEDIMRRLMSHPANKLEELLPDYWAREQGIL